MKTEDHIHVVPFSTDLREHFATLNKEWIEKFFEMEDKDKYVLHNPEEAILAYGGQIFFALAEEGVVGTCALVKVNDHTFEISKMAVTPKFQGMGIGALLMAHAIAVARARKVRDLVLYSNTGLKSAVHMYRKFGFKEAPKTEFHSKRSNIKMHLSLKSYI